MEAALIGLGLSIAGLVSTELYCHRCLAHRSVDYPRWLRAVFDVTYRATVGTDPRAWAIVHRRHHRFADKSGDPHSPHAHGVVYVLVASGILFHRARPRNLPPAGGPRAAAVALRLAIVTALLPFFAPHALVLATAIHISVYLTVVGAINGLGHSIGGRPFPQAAGTNIPWLSLPLLGQSYQNNHHFKPTEVRMGRFDPMYPVILGLELIGVARVGGR